MSANLVDQLDTEWADLVATTRSACTLWSDLCEPLRGLHWLDQILDAVRGAPDEVLGFLLDRCHGGDVLAGRTVLQAMLGKLVKMSYTATAVQQPDALSDLVTHMWCQIARYPLDRRPQRIAANLALDTLKAAHREWRGGDLVQIPLSTPAVASHLDRQPPLAPDTDASWTAEALIGAAYDMGRITRTTHDILISIYGTEALSGLAAAARWNCSSTAIRTRCRTAIHKQLQPLVRQLTAA